MRGGPDIRGACVHGRVPRWRSRIKSPPPILRFEVYHHGKFFETKMSLVHFDAYKSRNEQTILITKGNTLNSKFQVVDLLKSRWYDFRRIRIPRTHISYAAVGIVIWNRK